MERKIIGFEQQDSDHLSTSVWNFYKLIYQKLRGVTWNQGKLLWVCSYVNLSIISAK